MCLYSLRGTNLEFVGLLGILPEDRKVRHQYFFSLMKVFAFPLFLSHHFGDRMGYKLAQAEAKACRGIFCQAFDAL